MDPAHSTQLQILVEEAQNGSERAFQRIFERLSDKLFPYALSRTGNRDDALDIVQETFVDLWSGLGRFMYRSDEEFYSFTFTILKRKLYRHYKKTRNTDQLFDNSVFYESYETDKEDYRHLLKRIEALAMIYQDLLRLRYWSGLSFGEIASVLNITETAAKVRHHRALKQLKTNLDTYGNPFQ